MEIRTLNHSQANVRIETRDDGKRYITGYAAVFYREGDETTEFRLWDTLVERVKRGAFKKAIKQDDVRALLNHDPNMLLARTGNGLKLKEDDIGLYYEFPVDETDPDHLRVVAKLERGDLKGSSFGFEPVVRKFIEDKEYDIVVLEEVRLYDVSPATFPAYEGTSVSIRSTEGLKAEYDKWKAEQRSIQVDMDEVQIRLDKANAGIL